MVNDESIAAVEAADAEVEGVAADREKSQPTQWDRDA